MANPSNPKATTAGPANPQASVNPANPQGATDPANPQAAANPANPQAKAKTPAEIPAELEVAIFKRFWIWVGSLSAIILALGGVVWALSVAELREYAKNVSENKTTAEFKQISANIAEEMQRLRTQLSATTDAAYKAMGDTRQQLGEANEVARTARRIVEEVNDLAKTARKAAEDIDNEIKRSRESIKSVAEIFGAKTETR